MITIREERKGLESEKHPRSMRLIHSFIPCLRPLEWIEYIVIHLSDFERAQICPRCFLLALINLRIHRRNSWDEFSERLIFLRKKKLVSKKRLELIQRRCYIPEQRVIRS